MGMKKRDYLPSLKKNYLKNYDTFIFVKFPPPKLIKVTLNTGITKKKIKFIELF